MPNAAQLAEYAKTLTPEQAFELYRATRGSRSTSSTPRSKAPRRCAGCSSRARRRPARCRRRRHGRAAEAGDMPSLMAAGQSVTQEAVERSMAYWGQMFELIVEIQKRLFALMEDQMSGVPGVKQAKAALAMMPDMTQMQNVVSAMQGVMSSGGSAFESMQKVMGDFARMTGVRR
jgi:hypothetical protein